MTSPARVPSRPPASPWSRCSRARRGASSTSIGPGNSAIEVQFAQAGTLRLNGNNGDAALVVDQAFTNSGTLELTGTSWSGRLTVTNGALTNTGTVQTVAGAANRITGAVDNQGTLLVQSPLTVFNNLQTFTSTGGTLNVAGGETLVINNGTVVVGSGTGLAGTGMINLTGSPTLSLPTTFTLASGEPTWQFGGTNGVTVDGPGSLVNEVSLSLQNDAFNANVTLNNTGTVLVLPGTSAINGPFTQAGTLRLNGNNGDAALVVDQAFTNAGTLELTGTSWEGVLTVTTAR